VGAYGQNATTEDLHITLLNDAECGRVSDVVVVMDGDDQGSKRADPSRRCEWTFQSPVGSFNTKITRFSLRLGRARTRCQKASFDAEKRRARVAFRCCEKGPVQQISVDFTPSVSMEYAREVIGARGDERCIEWGSIPGTLTDVQFDVEKVRLDIFPGKLPACGLVLNHAKGVKSARNGAPVSLTKADIVDVLRTQANAGEDCRAPASAGTAIDIAEATLSRQPLKSIEVKVK